MEKLVARFAVFYSCSDSPDDAPLLKQLERHLSVLKHQGLIATWHKHQIVAGRVKQEELDRQLNTAALILLLISCDFLDSESCGIEMRRALQRHEAKEAQVIPILLRPCDWQNAPFAGLKMLPEGNEPITMWDDRDAAWADVVKGIRQALGGKPAAGVLDGRAMRERERLRPDGDDVLPPIPRPSKRFHPRSVIVVSALLILILLGGTLGVYRTVMGHLPGNVSSHTALTNVPAPATSTRSMNSYDGYVSRYGTMFGFNAQHTHTNPYEQNVNLGTVHQLQQEWADPIPLGGALDSSAPAVAHGLVYIGSLDGNLYAFDAAIQGPPKWMASTGKGNKIHSSPAVANGFVYIVSDNGDLYAFDALTGEKKGVASVGDGSTSSPTVDNGMIYVGSNNGDLYAFDPPIEGQSNWVPKWIDSTNLVTRTGQRGIVSAPAVCHDLVYVSSLDGNLYAFDALTKGPSKWIASTGSFIDSSPAVANDFVYVGSQDGNLYAFDATTGKQKWSAPTGAIHDSSPAVANDVVYIGSWETHNLYAFNAITGGQPEWVAPTGDAIYSSPTVTKDLIYIGSLDDHLYVFDARTGEQKQSFPMGNGIICSPVVANDRVYVGSLDGNLHAFSLPAGSRKTAASGLKLS